MAAWKTYLDISNNLVHYLIFLLRKPPKFTNAKTNLASFVSFLHCRKYPQLKPDF